MGTTQAFCSECGSTLAGARFCPGCGVMTANALQPAATTTGDAAGTYVPSVGRHGASSAAPDLPRLIPDPSPAAGVGPTADVVDLRAGYVPAAFAVPRYVSAPPASPQEYPTTTALQAPAGATPASPIRRRLLVVSSAGVVLVLVLVLLIWQLTRGTAPTAAATPAGPSYQSQVAAVFAPVVAANTTLGAAVAALTPTGSLTPSSGAAVETTAATNAAQSALAALKPGGADATLAAAAKAALSDEVAWLSAVTAVLASPQSPMLSQINALTTTTQTAFNALGTAVPRAATSISSTEPLVAYANSVTAAAAQKTALVAFSGQVQALMTQSAPSYSAINLLFAQMSTIANGGYSDLTLAAAEQSINSIVANRSALAASAQSLPAPTSLAGQVRSALAAAFNASLADDQAINTCLSQNNYGSYAYIFQSCLSDSAPQQAAASAAKDSFRTLYNRLRAQLGLPGTSQRF
jgi:hypothetical protein